NGRPSPPPAGRRRDWRTIFGILFFFVTTASAGVAQPAPDCLVTLDASFTSSALNDGRPLLADLLAEGHRCEVRVFGDSVVTIGVFEHLADLDTLRAIEQHGNTRLAEAFLATAERAAELYEEGRTPRVYFLSDFVEDPGDGSS